MGNRTEQRRTQFVRPGLILAGCLLINFVLDTSKPHVSAAAQSEVPKAWIDARSVCIFPLGAGKLPSSQDELNTSLTHGWEGKLRVPDASRLVQIEGTSYPALDSLRIDLSDSTLPNSTKSEKVKPTLRVQQRVGVNHFELVGQPLLCNSAKLNVNVSAADAHLDLERDRHGKPIMLLSDAKEASLQFDATKEDLERVLLSMAREAGAPYGLTILRTDLKLTAETEHSVSAELHLLVKFAFVPAGMTFKAHVDVDDAMNARLTGLRCDGDEALGPLIVGLLRPGLAKYEGKTRPLISFPSPTMHLHAVQVQIDDAVHLHAAFGN